jgi:hypothetical protein
MRKIKVVDGGLKVVNGLTYTAQRIKNDKNGNPRYNVMAFGSCGGCLGGWNVQAYSVDDAINKVVRNNEA